MPPTLELILTYIIIAASFGACFLYKSIFLKIMSFILFYPIIHLFYLYNNGEPVRIINEIGFSYYQSYIKEAFYIYFLSIISFHFGLYKARNKLFFGKKLVHLDSMKILILILILIFSGIVSHPWLFGLTGRREMLLPGNGWVSIYIATYILLTISSKHNSFYLRGFLFLFPLYFIIGGERVNHMLYPILLIFLVNGEEKKIKSRNFMIFTVTSFLIIATAFIAGNIRSDEGLMKIELFYIFNYITAIESLHVYLSSFWYVEHFGTNKNVFINIVSSFIPFYEHGGAGSIYFFEKIISSEISTVGGGPYLTEGYIAFGAAGAALWSYLLGSVVRYLFIHNGIFHNAAFLIIFALSFRVFWYGWEYIITPIYIIFIYLFILNLKKIVRKKIWVLK